MIVAEWEILTRLVDHLKQYGVRCYNSTTLGKAITCFYGNLRIAIGELSKEHQVDLQVRLSEGGTTAEVLVPTYRELSKVIGVRDLSELAEEVFKVLEELTSLNPARGYVASIKRAVEDFASRAREVDRGGKTLEKVYLALGGISGTDSPETPDPDLVWSQVALSVLLSSALYEKVRGFYGLPPLRELLERGEPLRELGNGLKNLSVAGYRPQIGPVVELLKYVPLQLSLEVRRLAEIASELAIGSNLTSADLPGRVFREVIGDIAVRKGFATYYTEVPAAYLLTYLATRVVLGLSDPSGHRGLAKTFGNLKVADFACGTGILLTSTYYNLLKAIEEAHLTGAVDYGEQLLQSFVEDSLYCFEAMEYATHVASLNLTSLSPRPARRVNVYYLPLGYVGGEPRLGSLDLIENSEVLGQLATVTPGSFDLVVMNPPFTRATGRVGKRFAGRGGKFLGFVGSEDARRSLVAKLAKLRKEVGGELARVSMELLASEASRYTDLGRLLRSRRLRYYAGIGQAGVGLLFLYLAYRYVKPGRTIAFVLPRNLLAGISWFPARALLASKFHLRYVIVSSDPVGGYNFSEGASFSEVLLVATRVDSHGSEETVFVNLLRKPRTPGEAVALVDKLLSGVRVPSAVVRVAKREEILRLLENWNTFVAVPDGYLVDYYLRFLESGEVSVGSRVVRVPLTRFTYLVSRLGVSSPQFHSYFRVIDGPSEYSVVYGGAERVRLRILVEPNAYAAPRAPYAVELFSKYSSRLLLPDRIWWDTAHALVLYSSKPTISNVFYSARLRGGEDAEKSVVAYLNTTWGLLTVLFSREETRGRWTRLKVGHWRLIPVLDIGRLEGEAATRLVELFNRVSGRPMKRVVEQYNPNDPDPVRLEIDLGFLSALDPGLDLGKAEEGLLKLYGRIHRALSLWFGERPSIHEF